mgnify:CR=1 FL=1
MYYIGTGNKYIATKSDGYMFVTEDLSKARRYSTVQRAGQALVSLPRRFYNISTQWSVRQDIVEDNELQGEIQSKTEQQTVDREPDETVDVIETFDNDEIDYLTLFDETSLLSFSTTVGINVCFPLSKVIDLPKGISVNCLASLVITSL